MLQRINTIQFAPGAEEEPELLVEVHPLGAGPLEDGDHGCGLLSGQVADVLAVPVRARRRLEITGVGERELPGMACRAGRSGPGR